MAFEDVNQVKQNQSALVLANAAAVVSGVVRQIAGNDIATSLNGTKASSALIESLAVQRMLKTKDVK